jgi:hypothetical protein
MSYEVLVLWGMPDHRHAVKKVFFCLWTYR